MIDMICSVLRTCKEKFLAFARADIIPKKWSFLGIMSALVHSIRDFFMMVTPPQNVASD